MPSNDGLSEDPSTSTSALRNRKKILNDVEDVLYVPNWKIGTWLMIFYLTQKIKLKSESNLPCSTVVLTYGFEIYKKISLHRGNYGLKTTENCVGHKFLRNLRKGFEFWDTCM